MKTNQFVRLTGIPNQQTCQHHRQFAENIARLSFRQIVPNLTRQSRKIPRIHRGKMKMEYIFGCQLGSWMLRN